MQHGDTTISLKANAVQVFLSNRARHPTLGMYVMVLPFLLGCFLMVWNPLELDIDSQGKRGSQVLD